MKKIKTMALIVMAFALLAQSFACGGGGGNTTGGETLKITVQDAGYGTNWVNEMAAGFEEKTGTKVSITETYDTQSEFARLALDNHDADIIFLSADLYSYAEEGHLYEITDSVYNKTPLGEDGGKKVKEVCQYTNAMKLNGEEKYYCVPFASGYVGLLYNETTLNTVLGEEQWNLPNTTDELFDLLNDIKTNHADEAYGLVGVSDYLSLLVPTWWAQYDGADVFFDYWSGHKDGLFCYDSPEMAKTAGRLEALKVLEKLVKQSNGYIHKDSGTFFGSDKFKEGQRTVVGKGYGQDRRKVAFYPCGDWFENEMGDSLMAGQNIKMMKMPIISTIKNTFSDATDKNMTDETLSAIVSKIDDGVAYSQEVYNCAESTYNKVKEARNCVGTFGVLQQGFIPVSSKMKDEASDFLRYIASKEGQIIFSKTLKGLSSPYGYVPKAEDGIVLSEFSKSIYKMIDEETTFIYRDISKALANRGGIAEFTTNLNKYFVPLYKGEMTATEIYEDTYNTLNTKWQTILRDAGISK